eukprot:1443757-Amphidinium_carterae.1
MPASFFQAPSLGALVTEKCWSASNSCKEIHQAVATTCPNLAVHPTRGVRDHPDRLVQNQTKLGGRSFPTGRSQQIARAWWLPTGCAAPVDGLVVG